MSHPQQLEVIHRFSEGSKKLLRELFGSGNSGNTNNKLDQLFVKLSTIEHQQVLLLELIEGETGPITNLQRKVNELMATQEERLQAILVAVQNVKQMLADLKVNNPAIEDEIAAIEKELAPAEEPPTT